MLRGRLSKKRLSQPQAFDERDETLNAVMPGHSSLPRADYVNLSAIPGIHVFLGCSIIRGWPGHLARRRASRFCPAMTSGVISQLRGTDITGGGPMPIGFFGLSDPI